MNNQKWLTLGVYAIMAVAAVVMSGQVAQIIIYIFAGLALAHLVEFFLMYGRMRAAGGSMAGHFLHTMLFGFMHWKPLPKA